MRTTRFTTVTLFCTFALFGAALLPLMAILLDGYEEANVPTRYVDLVSAYPLLDISSATIPIVSLLAGMALLAAFLVLAAGGISDRRWSGVLLLLVPALVVALVVFAPVLLPGGSVYVRQLMLALLGVGVSVLGVGAAFARPALGAAQWRVWLAAATATTVAMALVALGAITWLITLWLHASLLHFSDGLNLATGSVSAITLAAVVAVIALGRAFATRGRGSVATSAGA